MTLTIRQKHELLIRLLREARKKQAINQEELSARLGKHRVFVTKYESGDRQLNLFELMAICRELSLDIHAVIRGMESDMPTSLEQDELYLHGFCKGFLLAKGYEVSKGKMADDATE